MTIVCVPDGVTVYDNGDEHKGGTFDRYTVIFSDNQVFCMSKNSLMDKICYYYGDKYLPEKSDKLLYKVPETLFEQINRLMP